MFNMLKTKKLTNGEIENRFFQGYALACATLYRLHGGGTELTEMWNHCGIKIADLKKYEIDQFDIDSLIEAKSFDDRMK